MGADTEIEAFVRDDAGPVDTSGAMVRIYAGPGKEVVSFPATGDASGRVAFTVDGNTASQNLQPGIFALRVELGGRVVYTANLEMV